MSRFYSYLNTAVAIVRQYDGSQPLASFLKSFFAAHKKHGSKDRKQISHLCYCYYRTGKMFVGDGLPDDDALRTRILSGLFLCPATGNDLLNRLKPEWTEKVHLSLDEKCKLLSVQFPGFENISISNVFPWRDELSEGIDHDLFCVSFFTQPQLFIRLRPGYNEIVKKKLDGAGVKYQPIDEDCIAFDNATKLEGIVAVDKEAVVQDYSSRQVSEFLKSLVADGKLQVWDCCAASGGKSILAKDVLKKIDLTVSDIRKSILINLDKRFATAGIKNYTALVADLTNEQPPFGSGQLLFDLIICDVPCSGSGTWSRTPEQLFYWHPENIKRYVLLQAKIISNVIRYLKPGGHLLYITCSVFKKENEDVVSEASKKFDLQVLKMDSIRGYDKKADTMFAALLKSRV
ncbi:MAG TPA: methyltransferase domain-containing protein [Agriterribacter sp.]|nr:methyltransferase domain-containing protein [Agriterribacter sp.]